VAVTVTAATADTAPRPRFTRIIRELPAGQRASSLPTFKYTYKYNGTTYTPSFVGTDPSKGAVATTVPTVLIPVEMITSDGTVTNPNKAPAGSKLSVTKQVVASPIFSSGYDFQTDKTDIGSTQFVDAFEKMALWNVGGSATGYHVVLGQPKIEKLLKLKVPKTSGTTGTEFGIKVQEVDINYFDQQITAQINKLKLPSGTLPIFITTQAYLTSGGCCIGGYHSVNGSEPYSYATYIATTGTTVVFSQDVGALSHEISEWQDDPFTNNRSPCGIYEVGDPLERETNYGLSPYTLGGFVYHLQDEAAPPYFGAPVANTLGGYATFLGTKLSVCQNGA
jgi:hypothetical protein